MRTRLLALLLALMSVVIIVPGVMLARSIAAAELQAVFVDRLNDTTRFASIARQGGTDADRITMQGELNRYEEVYRIGAAIVGTDGSARVASPSMAGVDDALAHERVSAAMSGRRSENPVVQWPWNRRPLVVAEPILVGGDVIGVAITSSSTDALHRNVLRRWSLLALGLLAALMGGAVLALRVTRWVLRPVHTLDAAAHAIATGQLSARIPRAGGPPELRRLAGSFNEMAGNVEVALERQRAFVADASHQLRNPLSALMLRLEQADMSSPAGHSDDIEMAAEEGRRLANVLDELLMLTRVEHASGPPQVVDAFMLASDRVRTWSIVGERRGIDLCVGGVERAMVRVDPSALEGGLDALIDNSLKFSPEDSRVQVVVTICADRVVVRVDDQGPGLDEEELDRVGDRFWRSPRHQNIAGSGLGLAIVRASVERFGGHLRASNLAGGGLSVAIDLPAADGPLSNLSPGASA